MSIFGQPRWEIHPDYRPFNLAAYNSKVGDWYANRPVESTFQPVATITPSRFNSYQLRRQIQKATPFCILGNLDTFKNTRVEEALENGLSRSACDQAYLCLSALQGIVGRDMKLSNIKRPSITSVDLYAANSKDPSTRGEWFNFASNEEYREALNEIHYSVAFLNSDKRFTSDSFTRNSFFQSEYPVEGLDIHNITQPVPGVVTRYDSMTVQTLPKTHYPNTNYPRLVMEMSVRLPD